LTEAGKLYLNDYYVLDEAREDLINFLNSITDQVYEKWLELKNKELMNQEEILTWGEWKSKSTPGHIEFAPRRGANNEYGLLEEGKTGINLNYGDVRHRSELHNPSSVQLHISVVNNIKKKLSQLPTEKLKQAKEELKKFNIDIDLERRTIYRTFVNINPEDPQSTVDEIVDTIIEKCQGIEALIKHSS